VIDGFAIVDGHAHTYMDDLAGKIISTFTELHMMEPTASLGKGTFGDLAGKMRENGIDLTVTANFGPVKAVDRINRWNLRNADELGCIIPLVSVYPGMSSDALESLAVMGAKGVKMHNGIQEFDACDPSLDDVYEVCARLGLPVTLHCGEVSRHHLNDLTDECHIEDTVRSHPDVTFVITHLAGADPDTVFHLASAYTNIMFDTSIAFTGEHCIHRIHDDFWEDDDNAAEAFRRIGCDRVTFGSDYPYGNPISDVRRILSMDLTHDEKAMILGRNTMGLYGVGLPVSDDFSGEYERSVRR